MSREADRGEQAARFCLEIKRSLTHIVTASPSAIPGLAIERLRLLCADELKERVNAVSAAFQNGYSDAFAGRMGAREGELLDGNLARLAALAEEIGQINQTLALLFKSWSPSAEISFEPYVERLEAVSHGLEELDRAVRSLLYRVAETAGGEEQRISVQERLRQACRTVSHSQVHAALTGLEGLARRHYDFLDGTTKAHVESHYLPTLELVLGELARAEQAGEGTENSAQLSIRAIQVLTQIMTAGEAARRQAQEMDLEAEVAAMERLAALRGECEKK